MPREISSIKPEIRNFGKGKKIVAGRTTVREPEEIQLYYDTSEYDTFEKEGFQPQHQMKDLMLENVNF